MYVGTLWEDLWKTVSIANTRKILPYITVNLPFADVNPVCPVGLSHTHAYLPSFAPHSIILFAR